MQYNNQNKLDFETLLRGLPEVNSISADEAQTLAQTSSPAAKEKLVLGHMREAFVYARQCCRAQIEDGEIYSFCYKALVESARNFKSGNGSFFGYAKSNLRGHISRYWKTQDTVKNAYKHETGPEPEEGATTETEDGREPIESDYVEPDFKSIITRERLAMLKPLMETKLNEQERMVLELNYIGGFNFEDIGRMLTPPISRSAVQQTHARAIKKLRLELTRQKKLF